MNTFFNKLKIVNTNKISAVLAVVAVSMVVLACNFSFGKPEMPSDAETTNLVKGTMSDFAEAVEREDFSAFMNGASKEFKAQFTADQLKDVFKVFINKKDVVVPILRDAANMEPKFSPAPAMREEKGHHILVANGTFDTEPAVTNFDTEYVYQDGAWKLLKIEVRL